MIVYCIDRESDGEPVGEAESPSGVLDLIERAGPGSYRVHKYLVPYGVPKLVSCVASGVATNVAGIATDLRPGQRHPLRADGGIVELRLRSSRRA